MSQAKRNPPKPAPKPRNVKIMKAIFNYQAQEEDELSFSIGDHLYILDQGDVDWWKARRKGVEGLVPSNHVEEVMTGGLTMHDAAKRGNLDLLKECLINRLPINHMDEAGNSPLHWAARTGQNQCVKELITVPMVSLDLQNKLGDTPLILAANHGHDVAIELLLKAGANYHLKNNEGKVAMDMAKDPNAIVKLKRWTMGSNNNKSMGYDHDDYGDTDEED